jgi:hypothetical protein
MRAGQPARQAAAVSATKSPKRRGGWPRRRSNAASSSAAIASPRSWKNAYVLKEVVRAQHGVLEARLLERHLDEAFAAEVGEVERLVRPRFAPSGTGLPPRVSTETSTPRATRPRATAEPTVPVPPVTITRIAHLLAAQPR